MDYTELNSTSDPFLAGSTYLPESIVQSVILLIICSGGILLNLLVILSTIMYKKLHKPSSIFICSLSISDLVLCTVVYPFHIHTYLMLSQKVSHLYCEISELVSEISTMQTLFAFPLIAYNRCMFVTKSKNDYRKLFTVRNSVLMIISKWFMVVVITIATTFGSDGSYYVRISERWCLLDGLQRLNSVMDFGIFGLCFAITTWCYLVLFLHVHAQTRNQSNNKNLKSRNMKVVASINMIIITLVFTVCCAPIIVLRMIDPKLDWISEVLFRAFRLLMYSTSLINPIMFAARNHDYWKAMKCLIRCQHPGKKRDDSQKNPIVSAQKSTNDSLRNNIVLGKTGVELINYTKTSTPEKTVKFQHESLAQRLKVWVIPEKDIVKKFPKLLVRSFSERPRKLKPTMPRTVSGDNVRNVIMPRDRFSHDDVISRDLISPSDLTRLQNDSQDFTDIQGQNNYNNVKEFSTSSETDLRVCHL